MGQAGAEGDDVSQNCANLYDDGQNDENDPSRRLGS